VQEADDYLRSIGCRWSVIDELHKDEKLSKINNPAFSQSLCAAPQIGIIDLMNTWGIQAAAVVGHSSGEIAAAYAAGGLSKESAWKVAYHRGALSAGLTMFSPERGSMMSVGLSEDEAQRYLSKIANQGKGHISIGCINSPKNVTITGSVDKIDILKSILNEKKIFARKLKVDSAYHSSYMKETALDYGKRSKISPQVTSQSTANTRRCSLLFRAKNSLSLSSQPCRVLGEELGLTSQVFRRSCLYDISSSGDKKKETWWPEEGCCA
jgi:malonyl CoA-acyl carrier protein transacylase